MTTDREQKVVLTLCSLADVRQAQETHAAVTTRKPVKCCSGTGATCTTVIFAEFRSATSESSSFVFRGLPCTQFLSERAYLGTRCPTSHEWTQSRSVPTSTFGPDRTTGTQSDRPPDIRLQSAWQPSWRPTWWRRRSEHQPHASKQ